MKHYEKRVAVHITCQTECKKINESAIKLSTYNNFFIPWVQIHTLNICKTLETLLTLTPVQNNS
jgi:hypothetical protein